MYSKANPGAGKLSAQQKRIFAIAGALVILLLGGLGIWGAVAHDSYTGSGHGCVNLTVPSSTGGSTLHYCGSEAQSFCQRAFRSQDPISLRARPQCVLAGLGPTPGASPDRSGLQVEDDRDRAVVDQGDLHVGAEDAGLHPGTEVLQG
jgi:hypothetical protein